MKYKLHKIKNVPLDICSCEQKIAYNLAFALIEIYRAEPKIARNATPEAFAVFAVNLHNAYGQFAKYDKKAIKAALANGIDKYNENFFIASDYETIGNTFTLNVEVKQ